MVNGQGNIILDKSALLCLSPNASPTDVSLYKRRGSVFGQEEQWYAIRESLSLRHSSVVDLLMANGYPKEYLHNCVHI